MRKSETLNLRVSREFKRRLVQEAKKEKRSVTNYLEATLTQLWQQKDSTAAGKPRRRKKKLS
jgi:predicted HicB family RNase H-like nuclease